MPTTPKAPPTSGGTFVTPTEPFKVETVKPAVQFLTKAVQPPSMVYVGSDEVITCGCATSQANEVITVSYRLLRADGQIVMAQFTVNPPSTRALTIHSEQLAEGFLLSLSCKAAVATTRGQTFVRLFISNPALGAGFPSYMLMADYVTTAMAPAFPNGRQLTPVEGPGRLFAFTVAPPAAGVDWTTAVPTNARWRVRSIFATLTTSAAAGNRQVKIFATVGGVICNDSIATQNIAPSSTISVTAQGLPAYTPIDPGTIHVGLAHDLFLLAGTSVSSATLGLAPGDQWSGPNVLVEEWLDNV